MRNKVALAVSAAILSASAGSYAIDAKVSALANNRHDAASYVKNAVITPVKKSAYFYPRTKFGTG